MTPYRQLLDAIAAECLAALVRLGENNAPEDGYRSTLRE